MINIGASEEEPLGAVLENFPSGAMLYYAMPWYAMVADKKVRVDRRWAGAAKLILSAN